MPPVDVNAELKRRDALSALVDWILVGDAENTDTGLSDPVIDHGVRDRLDALIVALQTDALTNAELRASDVNVFDTFGEGFRATDTRPTELRYAERLTADATITPTAGTAIRIRKIGWASFDTPNTVLLRWADTGSGARNIWRMVATQQTVLETGDVDRPLEIVLFNTNPIDVNIHYEEV